VRTLLRVKKKMKDLHWI